MRRVVVAAASALLCCPTTVGTAGPPASPATDALRPTATPGPGGDGDRDGREHGGRRPSRSGDRGVADNELTVTLKKLNSTYLEKREPIRIRARVRNTTDQDWSDLQAYLVLNGTPLTDRDELREFADSPTETYSGERVSVQRDLTKIGDLDTGEAKAFTVQVPYKRLGIDPVNGVYEVGVHVLGTDEEKLRDTETDGRARTLLPYVDERAASDDPIEVSMLWPFTATVRRAADGTYPDAESLIEDIASNGRLGRMLTAAEQAGPRSITLLLDPALLEALSAIANDTYGPPESGSEPAPLEAEETSDGAESAQALANSYLARLRDLAGAQDVWTTPYAQPDLDALAEHERRPAAGRVYEASVHAARNVLDRFDVRGRVAQLPTAGVAELDSMLWAQSHGPSKSAPAVVSPELLDGWGERDSAFVDLGEDGETVPAMVDDGTVMSGGPLPGRTDSSLQVRQRLASEAALRAAERAVGASTSKQLGVVVDPAWNPGRGVGRTDLFEVLDAPWVVPASPERMLKRARSWRGPVAAPETATAAPLPAARVDAAAKIVRDGEHLASMVEGEDSALRAYYGGSASMVVSQSWREESPLDAQSYADDVVDEAGGQLAEVTIEGPGFVSLSGNSGPLPITIHNGLDVPIEVGVTIKAKGSKLSIPNMEPQTVQPGQSPSFTIDADIGEVSNTAFRARLTTPDGDTFGKPAEFNVQSSVVGAAIWIGMGVAGLLVVLALVRQIRRRRAAAALAGDAEQ